MALQIGVLVAFTQLIPEHQVQLFGVLKTRVKVCLYSYALFLVLKSASVIDAAYGVCDGVHSHVHYRFPMPLDRYPIRLACQLGLVAILQEESRYHGRSTNIW